MMTVCEESDDPSDVADVSCDDAECVVVCTEWSRVCIRGVLVCVRVVLCGLLILCGLRRVGDLMSRLMRFGRLVGRDCRVVRLCFCWLVLTWFCVVSVRVVCLRSLD